MSVCNIILTTDRVRLVSDTVSYLGRQPVALHGKVEAVPEGRFAISTRGARRIGDGFRALVAGCDSFAEAVQMVVEAVPRMNEVAADPRLMGDGYEATLAGWTDDGPAATRLTWRAKFAELESLTFLPGHFLAPSIGHHALPADPTDDQIVRLAFVQQQIAIRHGLNCCIGGHVEVTTIGEAGVEQRTLAEYPDKAMTEARIAAVDGSMVDRAAA